MKRASSISVAIGILLASAMASADDSLLRSLPRVERQYQQRSEAVKSGVVVPAFQGSASLAQARAAAFVASIGLAGVPQAQGHFCGGIVVDRHWILTAAHCVTERAAPGNPAPTPLSANKIQIVVDNNLSSGAMPLEPERIVIQPEFRFTAQGVPENDLAVLKLKQPAPGVVIAIASEALERIALRPGDRVGIAGWGTSTFKPESPISTRLLLGVVPVVARSECNEAYGGAVSDKMFCAGLGAADSCQGDSGGPAWVYDEQGAPALIGIVSWGAGCTQKKYPGVYVNIVKYREWIDGTIGKRQAAQ